MDRNDLGAAGVSVSRLGLGTMMLGSYGNQDRRACAQIIHMALDAGINLIDTADMYSDGESEEIVGEALRGRPEDVLVATKFYNPMGPDPNQSGGSRRWVIRAVDGSLRRLGRDHIDILQMHRPDPKTDLDETLSVLSDLVRQGKVRMIGTSTYPAEKLVEAQWCSDRRGHIRFRTEQCRYSILSRSVESAVLPTSMRYGIGVLTYGPLSSGWLSGRNDPTSGTRNAGAGARVFDLSDPANQRKSAAVASLSEIASQAGISLPHMAVAFAASHSAVSSVLLGPRTPEQLSDLLAGEGVRLGGDVLDAIDEVSPPGHDTNPADNFYTNPDLHPGHRRRLRPQKKRLFCSIRG